jgi:hypothetical protein
MWITSDEYKILQALPPQDINGVTTAFPCLTVNMGLYSSLIGVVQTGQGSTWNIWVNTASTATSITAGSTGGLMHGNYVITGAGGATTASTAGDVATARAAFVSTAKITSDWATTAANASIIVEIKADDMPPTTSFLAFTISTAAQAHPTAVTYYCKPRYPGAAIPDGMS